MMIMYRIRAMIVVLHHSPFIATFDMDALALIKDTEITVIF